MNWYSRDYRKLPTIPGVAELEQMLGFPTGYGQNPQHDQGNYNYPPGPPPGQGMNNYPPGPPPGQGMNNYPPGPPPGQGMNNYPPGPPPGQGMNNYPPGPPPGQGMNNYPPGPPPGQGTNHYPSGQPPFGGSQSHLGGGNPSVYAVDPGALMGCLYQYTRVRLRNGSSFWYYPTYIGRTSVAGYRWRNNRWVYEGMDTNRIVSFSCS